MNKEQRAIIQKNFVQLNGDLVTTDELLDILVAGKFLTQPDAEEIMVKLKYILLLYIYYTNYLLGFFVFYLLFSHLSLLHIFILCKRRNGMYNYMSFYFIIRVCNNMIDIYDIDNLMV